MGRAFGAGRRLPELPEDDGACRQGGVGMNVRESFLGGYDVVELVDTYPSETALRSTRQEQPIAGPFTTEEAAHAWIQGYDAGKAR
jgi:hypothetical protein